MNTVMDSPFNRINETITWFILQSAGLAVTLMKKENSDVR